MTSGVTGAAAVDPDGAQTMEGFGASGAWWPNDLVHFSPDTQERVAAMLFGPDGLGLSVYRYNIGGGGAGVTVPARAAETFLVAPGEYDWSRDPGGRRFLRQAAAMGIPALVGFVNTAPAPWTTNGRCCGGSLRHGAEADYARYLGDVVEHLADAEGAALTHVSPMNEPDDSFPGCIQEGMSVPVTQRAALVRAVADELSRRAPFARVIADESSRILDEFLPKAPIWLALEGAASAVVAVAHHLYDFPRDLELRVASLERAAFGRPMWMTEICCFDSRTGRYGRQYDPTMAGAMPLANLVWQSLTLAGDCAFHWWVALSSQIGADPRADPLAPAAPNEQGFNDGLVYYDPRYAENGNEELYVTKRYWALANFSRYVRPGHVRHEVHDVPDGLRALAFRSPAGGWVLVAINNAAPGGAASRLRVELPHGQGTVVTPALTVETSGTRDLEPVANPELDAAVLTATLPAQSVTTMLLAAGPGCAWPPPRPARPAPPGRTPRPPATATR
jgi:O-glycosyl hydrolase